MKYSILKTWFIKPSFIIILLLNITNADAEVWYIDNVASGTNEGTSWVNAWQNFSDINWSSIGPGDTIFISGGVDSKTYTERWSVQASGTEGNPIIITVDAANNDHNGIVIFDFNADGDLATQSGIRMTNKNWVTINGNVNGQSHIQINNLRNISSRWQAIGITSEKCGNIVIEYLSFTNNNVPISFTYSNDKIVIRNCSLYQVRGDAGLKLVGGDFPFNTHEIYNNYIEPMHNNADPQGGTSYGGPDGIHATSGVSIYNNVFKQIKTNVITSNQHPDMIQATGNNMQIYNNEFIDVGDSHIDFDFYSNTDPHDIWIYNNIFRILIQIDPYPNFIRIYSNGSNPLNSISNLKIFNNLFVDNELTTSISMGFGTKNPTATGIEIKNNIFYNLGETQYDGRAIGIAASTGYDSNSFSFDANIYYNPEGKIQQHIGFLGTDYLASNWISTHEPRGKTVAPHFISYIQYDETNDFHLHKEDTIAKDEGVNLSSFFLNDKDKLLRGALWDIGPYEYNDGFVPQEPDIPKEIPESTFDIENIYPNPFNTNTRISYNIHEAGTYKINIYNFHGQLIKNLFEGELTAGNHEITWNAANASGSTVPNGGYIIRLSTGKSFVIGKIVVLK